ncbi:MAG: hypothetical protein KF868_12560 [Acidobacteria bacterium]|nr:hypothetical protein [Acidobacteriota bacterium]
MPRKKTPSRGNRFIRFTPDLEDWLVQESKSGGYSSVQEFLRHLVRQYRDQAVTESVAPAASASVAPGFDSERLVQAIERLAVTVEDLAGRRKEI